MRFLTKLISISITYTMLLALYACSGGDSSNTLSGRGDTIDGDASDIVITDDSIISKPGTITISITDAVVDSAQEVWVQFTGLTIQPSTGDAIDFIFDSEKNINLLGLQGILSTDLISNEVIPTGSYDWIRLHVNAADDDIMDSYIRLDDGSVHEFSIPSGSQTGLKINTGFEFIETEELKLMIDFDLRKSVVVSAGKYKLRPTLRMVNLDDTNSISGSINSSLLTAATCSDTDPSTGNAVYLFEGLNITPDDMDNKNPEPVSSARVELNSANGDYEYIIGFVTAGDYTLAFTCQADVDDPSSNDSIEFSLTENVTVVAPEPEEETQDEEEPLPDPVR